MGFADLWNRTLVYFGIAEEDDYWDEDGYVTNEELERRRTATARTCAGFRRAAPRRVRGLDGLGAGAGATRPAAHVARALRARAGAAAAPPRGRAEPDVRVHLVLPRSFNDAQQIADKFKDGIPVILNLQSHRPGALEAADRLRERAHLRADGGMQRVADKVFLLTPRNVEVSAEERARLLERGGFFNQA